MSYSAGMKPDKYKPNKCSSSRGFIGQLTHKPVLTSTPPSLCSVSPSCTAS